MKKERTIILLLTIFSLVLGNGIIFAQTKRTIHVATAGTLSNYISESEKYQITDLTLTGEINGDDLGFLREMAGQTIIIWDGEFSPTDGKLRVLDMSEVRVVAGGGAYFINDDIGGDYVYCCLENDDEIPSNIFKQCSVLTTVIIPNSVTSIGYSAFQGCSGLTSVTIPNNVTFIGGLAFQFCSGLTSIVSEIENPFALNIYTFYNDIYDTATLTVPAGTKALYQATAGWNQFKNIVEAGGGSSSEDVRRFESGGITYNVNDNGTTVTVTAGNTKYKGSISIPSSVSYNGKSYDVTSIGYAAFSDCTGLTSISIPNSVGYIQYGAFQNCSGLSSITLPKSIVFIDQYAFISCSSLTKIVSEIESPFSLEGSTFDNSTFSNATLTVPAGTKSLYQSTGGWKNFKNIVEAGSNEVQTKRKIHVSSAGTLSNSISENEKYQIEELTLTGEINGSDLGFLREMAGRAILGPSKGTVPTLKVLDMSEVRVVAGGVYTIVIDDIKDEVYSLNNDNELPASVFCDCSSLTSVALPTSVTSIGGGAFSSCSGLTSITIPSSVTYIGSSAFSGTAWYDNQPDGLVYAGKVAYKYKGEMPAYTNIILRDGTVSITDQAFSYCRGLTSITIPNSMTSIGYDAFGGCNGLTSITIPKSVTSIGNSAFLGCNSLISIVSEIEDPFAIDDNTFYSNDKDIYSTATLTVPAGTKVKYQATSGWNQFKNIFEASGGGDVQTKRTVHVAKAGTLSSYISDKEKYQITELTLTGEINGTDFGFLREMAGKTKFGNDGVYNDTGGKLSSLDMTGVTVIAGGDYYRGWHDIDMRRDEYDYLRNNNEIPSYVFNGCKQLRSIAAPNNLTSIGDQAFQGCIGLSSINIPNSVTSIGTNAFSICSSLTSITIPNRVTSIGYGTFYGCSSLTSITIPNSVTSIGMNAFSICSSLTSITIPNSVTLIDEYAFEDCNSLTSIVSKIENTFAIDDNTFYSDNKDIYATATLTVPAGTKAKYQATEGWKLFKNIVEAAATDELEFTIDGATYIGSKSSQAVALKAVDTSLTSVEIPASVSYDGTSYQVTGIDDNAFSGCMMAALIWDVEDALPYNAFSNASIGSNFLLYVKSASYAPSSVKNVVVNGTAQAIVLSDDGGQFYCPQAFTADKISYTHNYNMETGGDGKGWETIALPFNVQKISHSTRGEIIPFASYSSGSSEKPFWLANLASNGFRRTSNIQSNEPYIIAMPNNSSYRNDYILAGDVTFYAENASVPKTPSFSGKFVPAYSTVKKASNVYAINAVNRYVSETGGYDAGSRFISNLRDIRPFEAYMSDSSTRGIIEIGSGDGTTGMEEIFEISESDKEVSIYTLNGQKVMQTKQHDLDATMNQLPHGVYIVNRKKIVK